MSAGDAILRKWGGGAVVTATALLLLLLPAVAQHSSSAKQPKARKIGKPAPAKKAHPIDPLVAYDAHDHRYYLLSWAKAHGMRDPGGDPLRVMPLSRLPKSANPAIVPVKASRGEVHR